MLKRTNKWVMKIICVSLDWNIVFCYAFGAGRDFGLAKTKPECFLLCCGWSAGAAGEGSKGERLE